MENSELLFFDTFSHDVSDELNLDLVQFPKPVYIKEIRIIPLGARVQADFPGGVRLGATNPSQFEIEFFVNDLSKPGASTFESVGGLEYKQNIHIQLECEKKYLPTDGLVLRGWYTTITLAVYGTLTKSLSQSSELPSSPTPFENVAKQEEPVTLINNNQVTKKEQTWPAEVQTQENATKQDTPQPLEPAEKNASTTEPNNHFVDSTAKQRDEHWSEETSNSFKVGKVPSSPPNETLISLSPEPISPEEEVEEQDGDGGDDEEENDGGREAEEEKEEDLGKVGEQEQDQEPEEEVEEEMEQEENYGAAIEPFEPILSDEELMIDDAPSSIEYDCVTIQDDELYNLSPPELLNLKKHKPLDEDYIDAISTDKLRNLIGQLSKSVINFYNITGQEKELFVHNCENLCSLLQNFECSTIDIKNLSEIIDAGLNMEFAYSQPQPAYKIRHVKIGVRLAESLCRIKSGPEILLNVNVPYKLLSLCLQENVSLPVKLAAIRALDCALASPKIVMEFLRDENELYKLCLLMLDSAKLARLKFALGSLLRKIHVFEILSESEKLDELNLLELINMYACANTLMSQPKRQLPASCQMEHDRDLNSNPRAHLINYFDHWKLLNRLLVILCSPDSDEKLIKLSRYLLSLFSDSKEGLMYMLKEAEVSKCLLKVLDYKEPGLGSKIVWRLQVVQCLRHIMQFPNDWCPLKKLHSFLIYPEGLQAVISVLPMDNFIDLIISSLCNKDHSEFAAELISCIVRYSDAVHIFQFRASDLLKKSRNHPGLREVIAYLSIAAVNAHWNYGNVTALVSIIKKYAEHSFKFPGELITACRILNYLVFPPNNDVDTIEPYSELKYKNALTQLFAADGLSALVSVITNSCQFYEQPFLHCTALTNRQQLSLFSLLLPCVRLIKAILESLVKCMATSFKDLTPVVPLLGVYCLVEALPETPSTEFLLNEIVSTLLIFTQAVDADSSGNVAKSLWTQMLGEVLKMISSNPSNFIPGIKLLSKLLPPILTLKEIRFQDKNRIIGLRKLWSAHLQAQASSLTEMLRLLYSSWNIEVLSLVSIVSKQLSDLAAPTALLVGRCLLDGILSASTLDSNLHILALFSDLIKHAPMKATILTLTSPTSRAQVKSDQKYPPVIELLCSAVRGTSDADVQREIIDAFKTLCDYKINLVQETPDLFEKQLSYSVPSKESLLLIIGLLLEIIGDARNYPIDILNMTVEILLSLINHNYGLYHVKSCLESKPDVLKSFLEYIVTGDNVDEKNCLSEQILVFLENLVTCNRTERTLSLRIVQLSSVLSWDKNGHPLTKIPQASDLVEALQNVEEKGDKEPIPEMLEPLLQPPEALLNQFAQRSLSIDFTECKSKNLYLKIQTKNTVDLLALSAELLPSDFYLLNETQKLLSNVSLQYTSHNLTITNPDQTFREAQKSTVNTRTKMKPFVTPMRGRNQYSNALRGGASIGGIGRGTDLFRSRPPNTSRPPSLHVDDFVALETCGAQPTGPTGYNKLNVRITNPPRGILSGCRSRPWVSDSRPYLR